jgi:hypothetical protein
MKKLILISFLFICVQAHAQDKFRPDVTIKSNTIISEVNSFTSVLFVFKGSTHMINYYLDLSKKLKKSFRKSKSKVKFNYDLYSKYTLESDYKKIPIKKNNPNDFHIVCEVSLSNMKAWDNDLLKKRKQSYIIDLKILQKGKLIESAKLNVKTYFTIITQNKKSSKLIHQIVTR